MSEHPASFTAQQKVSAETAQNLIAGDHNTEITAKPKQSLKDRLRRVLLATAAVVVLSGASFYGYDYVTVGRFLVSTDDAYVKADNTTIAPKVSGYLAQCWSATTSASRPARCWPASTTATSASRSSRPRPTSPPRRRRSRASRRSSTPSSRSSTLPGRRSTSTRRSRPSPSRRTSVTPTSPPPATAACRTRSRRLAHCGRAGDLAARHREPRLAP